MKKLFIFFVPFLLAGCSLSSTSGGQQSSTDSIPVATVDVIAPAVNEPASVSVPVPVAVPVSIPSVKTFSVTAKQWEFIPATIIVKEGDHVRLSIQSIDVAHGLSIPDFGINQSLQPGTTVNVEFVANKKGRFSFFCNVFCGDGHSGMKGLLIVE